MFPDNDGLLRLARTSCRLPGAMICRGAASAEHLEDCRVGKCLPNYNARRCSRPTVPRARKLYLDVMRPPSVALDRRQESTAVVSSTFLETAGKRSACTPLPLAQSGESLPSENKAY